MAVAITDTSTATTKNWQPFWHRSAPRRLVEHCGSDPKAGWLPWQKHLAGRKQPLLTPFLIGKRPPLWWALDPISDFTLPAVSDLLDSATDAVDSPAWLALAAAYSLPEAAKTMSAEAWWQLAERLQTLAADAEQMPVDRQSDPRYVLRQQLLAGELPLALGYLFPEVQSLRNLRNAARTVLSEALVEWTDGQGLLHGRLLPVLGPLWACWTRCRWMGQRLKRGCWSSEAEVQYQWLVRHAIRLTGVDGRFMLSDAETESGSELAKPSAKYDWPKGLYESSLELVGDPADFAAAEAILPGRVIPRHVRAHKRDLPDVSLESEWSGVTVLATDWKRSAARVAISHAEEPMRFELAVGRDRLLAGRWTSGTTCDGETVRVRGEWEQACWQSDDTCDYLELCAELSHGLRLERQLLLARTERVLYVADVVISADGSPRRLTHSLELPIGPNASWQPEKDTRDGLLVAGKVRAAVLPLALTEWRSDPRGGRLDAVSDKLALTQATTGGALYCPLLVDLDGRRSKKDRTWRQLTVAEALEIVAHDVAVGFRAQAGRNQWLFYRSLAPAGNRTLIGQNIAGEFYAGGFLSTGKLEEWIEIEACE